MNRKSMLGVALAGAIAMTTTVLASVTFNAQSGTGFVGKGDVQSAFGWNNAQAQQNIPSISFAAQESQTRTQVCEENGVSHEVTSHRHAVRSLSKGIAWDERTRNQITGIYLLGYAAGEAEWSDWGPWLNENGQALPGNDCPAGSNPHGQPQLGPIVLEGLFVTFNGSSVKIY